MHASSILKFALSAAVLTMAAQAHAVVEAGHWTASITPGSASTLDLYSTMDQTPGGDYTGVFSNYANGVLKGVTYNVDQGSDLFVVQKGAVFSNETVNSQHWPFIYGVSTEWGLTPQTATVGQEFYLGGRTRTSYTPGYFDTFGWAHFKVDATGQLKLLDSAVAFNEGGIIVGTLQAVPEPGTWALMGVGLAALAWRVRSSRQTKA